MSTTRGELQAALNAISQRARAEFQADLNSFLARNEQRAASIEAALRQEAMRQGWDKTGTSAGAKLVGKIDLKISYNGIFY